MARYFWAIELKTIYGQAYETLIKRLKEARNAAGLTQTTLACRLGYPQSFVSKFEAQERRLDPIEYLKIALAIGIDPYIPLKECEEYLKVTPRPQTRRRRHP